MESHGYGVPMGQILSERYEAIEVVSSGGFGTVYKAQDRVLPRVVALKVLHGHLKYDEVSMRRFVQEAEALTRLNSPHTCVVYDFGTLSDEEQRPYLAMEFIDGISLDRSLADGAVPLEQAIPIMQQMCRGINAAHQLGIIHRDIKPANIMLVKQADGTEIVRIVDFGLAKSESNDGITRTGETMGTPHYMSPEQCRGVGLDARADVYSLGCVFFEVVTGERLFDGNSSFDVMNSQINEVPSFRSHSDVPQWVQNLILRMVAKDPEDRFQSLSEVLDILQRRQLVKPVRQKRAPVTAPPRIILAAGLLLAFVGAGAVWISYNSAQEVHRQDNERMRALRSQQLSNKLADRTTVVSYEPFSPTVFRDDDLKDLIESKPPKQWNYLNLANTRVTNQGMKSLSRIGKSLRSLNITHTPVTDEGLMQLPPSITWLSANHTDAMHNPHALDQLSGLKTLHVATTTLNDEGLKELAKLPNLQELIVTRTKVTDAGINHLKAAPRLRDLHASETQLTDACIDSLLEMPLRSFSCRESTLTDAGLTKLAKHRTLEWVNVSGTRITTEGLMQFENAPRLKEMLVNLEQIDEDALRRALPKVRILSDSGLSRFSKEQ